MVDAQITYVDGVNSRRTLEENALHDLRGRVFGVLNLDAILLLERSRHQRLARGIGMAPPDKLSFLFGAVDQALVFVLGSDPPLGNCGSGGYCNREEKKDRCQNTNNR